MGKLKENFNPTGIQGYLRSTFPLYKLAKKSRFLTKNSNLLIGYTCFETPAYFSKVYNLAYRMQAYAVDVNYMQNLKSNKVSFDVGSKDLMLQDSQPFFKATASVNYGKLNKSMVYNLFPSMKRRLITQQLNTSASVAYLNTKQPLIVSSEYWFNSKIKSLLKKKTNYLSATKPLSEEVDQLISRFDSEWSSILKTKSSAYCLTTPAKYFALVTDADLNWDSLPYKFFRYYGALLTKKNFITKKFHGFWSTLMVARANVSLNNFWINAQELLIRQIKCTLSFKLQNNLFNFVGEAYSKNLLVCASYAYTLYAKSFLFSLLVSMLFKDEQRRISNAWIFNKVLSLYKDRRAKMLFEPGVNLLAKIKSVLPSKCLNLAESWNHFFFNPTRERYGTGISIMNASVKLRRMGNYLVNKKTKYNLGIVNNVNKQKLISLIAKFKLIPFTSYLLTKVKLNIENIRVYMLNLKYKLLSSKKRDLAFPLRLQLVAFETKIPDWTSNLQFVFSERFSNANNWLRLKMKASYNLIWKYLSAYNKALKSVWKWKFNRAKLINAVFFFFYIKKKVKRAHWWEIRQTHLKYLNLVYQNYHLFRWFYITVLKPSILIRASWMKLFSKKNLFLAWNKLGLFQKKQVLHMHNSFQLTNPYKVWWKDRLIRAKSFLARWKSNAVFWKFDFYKKALKYHKITTTALYELVYPKKWVPKQAAGKKAKFSGRNPNYKGKNYDPNYKFNKFKKSTLLNSPPKSKLHIQERNPNYKGDNYDPDYKKKLALKRKEKALWKKTAITTNLQDEIAIAQVNAEDISVPNLWMAKDITSLSQKNVKSDIVKVPFENKKNKIYDRGVRSDSGRINTRLKNVVKVSNEWERRTKQNNMLKKQLNDSKSVPKRLKRVWSEQDATSQIMKRSDSARVTGRFGLNHSPFFLSTKPNALLKEGARKFLQRQIPRQKMKVSLKPYKASTGGSSTLTELSEESAPEKFSRRLIFHQTGSVIRLVKEENFIRNDTNLQKKSLNPFKEVLTKSRLEEKDIPIQRYESKSALKLSSKAVKTVSSQSVLNEPKSVENRNPNYKGNNYDPDYKKKLALKRRNAKLSVAK